MEVENWDLDFLLKCVTDAITFAKSEGLPSMFVTEDTVRATPEIIKALYGTAIDLGADRLVVCDTTGHITPWGVKNLLNFIFEIVDEKGSRRHRERLSVVTQETKPCLIVQSSGPEVRGPRRVMLQPIGSPQRVAQST